jgi:excisionase family DNA binding protein
VVTMTEERLFTVEEAAERLRLSAYTVREYLRTGKLHGFRMGKTRAGWRVSEEEIRRFIADRRSESED